MPKEFIKYPFDFILKIKHLLLKIKSRMRHQMNTLVEKEKVRRISELHFSLL